MILLFLMPVLLHSFGYAQAIMVQPMTCEAFCLRQLKPLTSTIATLNNHLRVCESKHSINASARVNRIDEELKQQKFTILSNSHEIFKNRESLRDQGKLIEKRKRELRQPFIRIGSGYYYIEHTTKLNWFGAVHACLRYGGHLLRLNNKEELDALIPRLQKYGTYWTDINDLNKENEFLSITTGFGAEFLNWGMWEPNNGGGIENCVSIGGYNFRMNDFKCSTKMNFICEAFEE
ncbi:C-type lectin 37Db-like [Drosophila nasuta]|uniref:C-type lectin 37Db-like n=1 Tax=Drosophila nasuta TaxID=42062 RepID=UPI00295EE7CC|nr:C-type lectin 37Db-like [Drosophila nasuta]